MVPRPDALLLAAALLPAVFAAPADAATVLDCDRAGSPYETFQLAGPPAPVCLPGGPTGSFLRLADTTLVLGHRLPDQLDDFVRRQINPLQWHDLHQPTAFHCRSSSSTPLRRLM